MQSERPNQMTQTVEFSLTAQQCFFLLLSQSYPKEPVLKSCGYWTSRDMDEIRDNLY